MDSGLFELHAAVEDRHWWFVGRRRVVRALVEAVLPPDGAGAVVDIGAGTGANAEAFTDRYEVAALEPSPEAIALARRRFPKVRFVSGTDPQSVRPHAGAHAAYLLMDVAEHVVDDFALISGLVAAMEPGAHLLITVPAGPGLWSPHDVAFGHQRRYTVDRLAAVWEGLPVEVRCFADFNVRLAPMIRAVRAMTRRFGAIGDQGTDLRLPPAALNSLLTAVLAGERHRLLRALARGSVRPTGRGVSLLAVLRRTPGVVQVRGRPAGTAPDEAFRR